MRHRRATTKLGRKTGHRRSLLANQVCSLIIHERIRTTLAKARAVRPLAEKMVTLGKSGTLHDRRNAAAFLLQKDAVKKLFTEIAPRCADRNGGYTRIIKLGQRLSDAAPMAYIEWVDGPGIEAGAGKSEKTTESAGGKASKSSASSKSETKSAGKDEKAETAADAETSAASEPAPKPRSSKKSEASAE